MTPIHQAVKQPTTCNGKAVLSDIFTASSQMPETLHIELHHNECRIYT